MGEKKKKFVLVSLRVVSVSTSYVIDTETYTSLVLVIIGNVFETKNEIKHSNLSKSESEKEGSIYIVLQSTKPQIGH